MTKDVVARLRAFATPTLNKSFRGAEKLAGEAADEIERLERYVAALEDVTDSHGLKVAQARIADEPVAAPSQQRYGQGPQSGSHGGGEAGGQPMPRDSQ